ncbi:DUF3037 domain-containing protein [Granulicella cerasi]|uniref:DUF3037 domain-containing protein n=1 Tax=Granulicella cerasi TaxID=741063 RepID=A0ABW1Z9N4_9BACT|nr:DUF3037 domain-containing protein [Granulicella cerasi]
MSERRAYNYAVIRVVPRVERDEFVNAGVILYSQQHKFLGMRVRVNEAKLRSLWPETPMEAICKHLDAAMKICEGAADGGPIAKLSMSERFQWLTSPRSTMIQISPVRTGLTSDPQRTLDHLAEDLIS